jgi:hypothetical protein
VAVVALAVDVKCVFDGVGLVLAVKVGYRFEAWNDDDLDFESR